MGLSKIVYPNSSIDESTFRDFHRSWTLKIRPSPMVNFFYIFGKPLENVTLFVSETYPKYGQNPPEFQTLAGKTSAGRSSGCRPQQAAPPPKT